eukprot:Nitzschia sp. Nitz4//scaffold29_size155292//70400//72136//NITZ4_002660-RA/size155292-processed-gene-0.15-mRNA-1//1//CDS//3329546454//4553//frame0
MAPEGLETPLLPTSTTAEILGAVGDTMESLNSSNTINDHNNDDGDDHTDGNNHDQDEEIQTVATPWYRNPHQITAMISNYSTSYNVVNISLVLPILAEELHEAHKQTSWTNETACASSLLAGMIVGQLLGGALGDSFLGRLGALRLVMALQIIASLASAGLPPSIGEGMDDATVNRLYRVLALCRFVLGVGAGGVYPLAAVLSAEQGKVTTPTQPRNQQESMKDQVHRVVLTFSTQGLGFVTVPILAVFLLYVIQNLDIVWRILLAVGSVPGLVLLALQWKLYARAHHRATPVPTEDPDAVLSTDVVVETEDSAANTSSDGLMVEPASDSEANQQESSGWLESLQHEPGLFRKLLGTAGTWCLFDMLFYGNTIFQPIVVEAVFGTTDNDHSTPQQMLREVATNSLILTSIALPGYGIAGLLIGKRTGCVLQTPRYVMLQGFAAMAVLYATIGLNWDMVRHYPGLLLPLYGLTFFFANYGPNTTTFILPSLVYKPERRSTWNGISAAAGKLGALLGATLFAPAADAWGDASVMLLCAFVSILAYLLTYVCVRVDMNPDPENDDNDNTETPVDARGDFDL